MHHVSLNSPEVGICKRKQESEKTKNKNSTKKAIKKTRKQELDQESDQENKKTTTRPRKKEKNLVEFLFSFFLVPTSVVWIHSESDLVQKNLCINILIHVWTTWIYLFTNMNPYKMANQIQWIRAWIRNSGGNQWNCILENIRQAYVKIGVRVTANRQLLIQVLLFFRSWQIGVNFAFVLTPKEAVKSSR